MVDWFRRFGDIPGVAFARAPGVDPSRLSGFGAVPQIHAFEFEGRRRETLFWPANGGGGSASPAHERAFGGPTDDPTDEVLKRCYEGLEVPGEASDYHFLIQGCVSELWRRRRQNPEVLDDVVKLSWLDVQLIEARPDAIRDEFSDEPRFHRVLTFSTLIDLYEREGFLHEALDVAGRAARYGQAIEDRDRLAQRIAAVENEDVE